MRNIIIVSILMAFAFCSCQKINGNGDIVTETINVGENFHEVVNDTKFDVEVFFSGENKIVVTGESNIMNRLSITAKKGKLTIKKEKNKYKLRNTEPLTIVVYMQRSDYMYFTNAGSGNFIVNSPVAKKILIENSGSGDMVAYDLDSKTAEVKNSGSGNVFAYSPISNEMQIYASGSGNIHVEDTENEGVEVKNSGAGNIFVSGVAGDVKIISSGSGKVDCYHLIAQYVEVHSSGSGMVEAYATDEGDVWISGSGEVYVYGSERIRYHYTEDPYIDA